MTLQRTLSINNETRNLSEVRGTVSEVLEETSFTREMRNKIIVAVDEALANVVEHAYKGGTNGKIHIDFDLDSKRLEVRIRDNGNTFQPEEMSAVDIHKHIRLGLKGGLGLYLMRRIMDEVRFEHDETSEFPNELVMVKFLESGGDEGQEPASGE